jgi:protein-S-isoprenylcysteine O-methyltransferase Ste14
LGSFWLAFVPAHQFPLAFRAVSYYGGIALMVVGALLRRHCWRMLGASFTGDVRARSDQEVVSRGAYRIVRHPSYTAGIILNAGVGIALGSWASALLFTAASIAVYIHRMNVEERALLTVIGEPYRAFTATRKRLVPFLY